tara:strand:+ start:167 stop:493 length:327 start_codon:yes stop_codon:yes gene_type:complete
MPREAHGLRGPVEHGADFRRALELKVEGLTASRDAQADDADVHFGWAVLGSLLFTTVAGATPMTMGRAWSCRGRFAGAAGLQRAIARAVVPPSKQVDFAVKIKRFALN